MTEEEPREEQSPVDEGIERVTGFEPLDGVIPPQMCGHNLLNLIRDDWSLLGVRCRVAVCVLCGMVMVEWSSEDEGHSS